MFSFNQKRFVSLVLTFCSFCLVQTSAASLKLSVDQTQVPPGGTIRLNLIFEGMGGSPQIDDLKIDGFRTVDRSTSSSIRIINGVRSNSFTVSLTLLAERTGKFKVGPYELTLGQERVLSNSLELVVTNQPSSQKTKEKIFVKAQLSESEVVSGQQLFYILKVFRPAKNFGYSRLSFSLPEFKDMIVEEKQATQEEAQQVVNGELYQITEVKVPVFAVKQGTLEIPPGSVTYSVRGSRRRRGLFSTFIGDDFFSLGRGAKKVAYAPALSLNVKDLPVPRPPNFAGLVGSYLVEAKIDQDEVQVGENLTLTLSCTGIGALQDFKGFSPEIPGFRVYADGEGNLEKKRTKDGKLGGVKTFQFALVPQKEGQFVLGPFEISYFDPGKAQYITVKTKPLKLGVLKGAEPIPGLEVGYMAPLRQVEKEKIRILKKDILPIFLDWNAGRSWVHLQTWTWVLLFALVILGTVGLEHWFRVLSHRSMNPLQEAYRSAYDVYLQESQDPDKRLGSAFTPFLLRKLKQEIREVTPQEVRTLLERRELAPELCESILALMEQEESLRYSGTGQARVPQATSQSWNRLAKDVQHQL
jgi:hypothetical protein